ncbi:hypothetical protein [Streptomyces sp. NPDC048057]|uniref:hypothetical protein n=1 Tax=Streptomyces sp. NPDC048057 TaxID=3155628 RepID=UPI003400FC1C
MAGPEHIDEDDALYVLTAVLLTPAQFPSVLGDDYSAACAALELAPRPDGYGLVLGQDAGGARWTVVVDDASRAAVAIATWDCGMAYGLSPEERAVVVTLPGWPLALAVAAPGVPDPHDPTPSDAGGRSALAPPDTDVWGPAQRRLGADEVALQWSRWRKQLDDKADFAPPYSAADRHQGPSGPLMSKATDPPEAAAAATTDAIRAASTHPGLRRALAAAHGYLSAPPPVGRVRSGSAPGGARTLRADGPGWSMVARTDDIAFFLLDDVPGEVLPVGRGKALPALLSALDEMAVRPV